MREVNAVPLGELTYGGESLTQPASSSFFMRPDLLAVLYNHQKQLLLVDLTPSSVSEKLDQGAILEPQPRRVSSMPPALSSEEADGGVLPLKIPHAVLKRLIPYATVDMLDLFPQGFILGLHRVYGDSMLWAMRQDGTVPIGLPSVINTSELYKGIQSMLQCDYVILTGVALVEDVLVVTCRTMTGDGVDNHLFELRLAALLREIWEREPISDRCLSGVEFMPLEDIDPGVGMATMTAVAGNDDFLVCGFESYEESGAVYHYLGATSLQKERETTMFSLSGLHSDDEVTGLSAWWNHAQATIDVLITVSSYNTRVCLYGARLML